MKIGDFPTINLPRALVVLVSRERSHLLRLPTTTRSPQNGVGPQGPPQVSIRSRYNGCCPQGMAGRIEVFQRSQSQGEPLGSQQKRKVIPQAHMGVSKNRGTPKSSILICFNRVFHYKPSILGYPHFWKHPYLHL